MNFYAIIILTTLVVSYLLDLLADYLNLRALNEKLPAEFQGVYDAEAYRQSQQYTRVKTRFKLIVATIDLILLLAFWFSGGFNWLDQELRTWGFGPITTGLAYIGVLFLAKMIFSLPFQIYSTFVIEARFGFNKTTPATFVADTVKGLVLAVLIGGPLLAALLFLLEKSGAYGWFYCWMLTTLFTLVVQFIAPTWIMPWFNKFTPMPDGDLKAAILAYAQSVKFSLANIFVMDGSKRSTKANAFFTGFGRNKRIALFDTLMAQHSVAELVAVLAHEIGHYKKKHIVKGMVVSVLHAGVMFYLLSIFLTHAGLFEAFDMRQPSIYAGLIFFALLYTPIELILSIVMNLLSRRHEYEADHFAAETTGQPENMITALKKLSVDTLSNLTPHPLLVFLHYSHPPVLQRIAALRAMGNG
ncbi:MAG: Protease HtpX [bacterium]|nr:Protease HtpX [bacterium]